MNEYLKRLVLALALCGATVVVTGCEQKGPLEQAGETADEAVEETKDAVKDATN